MRQQVARQYTYAYAAVGPSFGQNSSLLPYANTANDESVLAQISIEFPDYFIILQVGQSCKPHRQELQECLRTFWLLQ